MDTDSYVVRIYRRLLRDEATGDGDTPEAMVGLVENANGTERRTFHNFLELWTILAGVDSPPGARKDEDKPARASRRTGKKTGE